jgi:hypothetical protein
MQSPLTPGQLATIKSLLTSRNATIAEIASHFKVSEEFVYEIVAANYEEERQKELVDGLFQSRATDTTHELKKVDSRNETLEIALGHISLEPQSQRRAKNRHYSNDEMLEMIFAGIRGMK